MHYCDYIDYVDDLKRSESHFTFVYCCENGHFNTAQFILDNESKVKTSSLLNIFIICDIIKTCYIH